MTPARVLVTGASGCAGYHLSRLALERGARVFGLARRGGFAPGVAGHLADVTRPEPLAALVAACAPDWIFHLAALVHGRGPHPDDQVLQVNVEGTLHLLEAARTAAPRARILVAGSSSIYAPSPTPVAEDAPLSCRSVYAVSKAAQDHLAEQSFLAHGLHVVRARAFNQIGPREPAGLLGATAARQIARIEAGLAEAVVRVASIEGRRDFCDPRDVAEGYWAALAHGAPGAAYNVCSGRSQPVARILDLLVGLASVPGLRVEARHAGPRPGDVLEQVGDGARLLAASGWRPRIPLAQSLADLLAEHRAAFR